MLKSNKTLLATLAAIAFSGTSIPALADSHEHKHESEHSHDHDNHDEHDHSHDHSHADNDIYNGYFDDDQVKSRELSDWQGEWRSVYPLLQAGKLDPVLEKKAANSEKTFAEYQEYYSIGYKTDVNKVIITDDQVQFVSPNETLSGQYVNDGFEILTYEKGNRGVRFVFRKQNGDEKAPMYIQFSDHIIAPQKSDHYHLYWGDDRTDLFNELINWPTYYPAQLSDIEIVDEMLAH